MEDIENVIILLLEQMKNANSWIRSQAFRKLTEVVKEATSDSKLAGEREQLLNILADAAKIGDVSIRCMIARVLENFEQEKAFDLLFSLANDSDDNVCFDAATNLAKLQKEEKAKQVFLAIISKGAEETICLAAAGNIGYFMYTDLIKPLSNLLNSTNWITRAGAVHALGELNAVALLDKFLILANDEHITVRYCVADALRNFENPQVVQTLLDLLDDPAAEVRWSATTALEHVGDISVLQKLEWLVENDNDEPIPGESISEAAEIAITSINYRNRRANFID